MINEHSQDDLIKPLQRDKHGTYRIVDGKKVYELDQKSRQDINLSANLSRAMDMSPAQCLQQLNRDRDE